MEDVWRNFEKWYLTIPSDWNGYTKKGWVANAYLAGWKSAQQSVQRTSFLAGLAVGILAMNIISVIVYSIFGCR